MRAIRLSLKAFGPYWEKQVVDFEELGGESIFLITGPTGAGKTTIFDAICYALYGRASGSDRDQDSLRSHFARMDEPTEVTYRFSLNQRVYEVIRNPKQSRKKDRGDGYTEEPAKAVLYEIIDDNRVLISSRIKEVNEALEEKLGFDYEQFSKMVLIPQGEFRKLISENSKEREVILQKIFRTYFHEKMTEELKTQAKSLKEQITEMERVMQQEITKMDWKHVQLDASDSTEQVMQKMKEEIAQTKHQLAELSQQKNKQQESLNNAQNRLHEGKTLEEKFMEQQQLKQEQTELNERSQDILAQKEQLKSAKAAQKIMPFEDQSNSRKQEWHKQKEQLRKQQTTIEQLEKENAKAEAAYKQAVEKEPEREQLKEAIKQAKTQLDQVTGFQTLQKEAKQKNDNKDKHKKQLNTLAAKIKDNETEMEKIEFQLNKEPEITQAFYLKREELKKAKEKVKQLKDLSAENQTLLKLRKNYQILNLEQQERKAHVTQLKEQYQAKDQKQKNQYAALMAHHLDDGQPCPVCGSVDHPDKAGAHETTVQESELDQLFQTLQQTEKDYLEFQEKFAACYADGQSQRATVQKLFEQIGVDLNDLEQNTIREAITNWQGHTGTLDKEKNKLAKRLEAIEALKKQRNDNKKRDTEFKQTFDQLTENYQTVINDAVKLETRLEELAKQLPENMPSAAQFKKQIEQMETSLQQQLTNWEKVSQQYQQSHNHLQKSKTILDQQKLFEENTKENFEAQYKLFTDAVTANGFTTINTYQEAKLPADSQQAIENQVTTYDKRVEQIYYRLDVLMKQIKKQARPNIEELETQLHARQTEFQTTSDTMYAIDLKLKNDVQTEQTVDKQLAEQKQLAEAYYSIGELAELANGNNQLKLSFERYVLASFLDEILLQANIRLDLMTDHRYQLMRSGQVAKRGAQSGLDLEVFDHHTGQKRSVKTLSGGEGFKAALSLALGLADVVQAHAGGVQLDTLFIDEGFGTLDEISLQQAIDCLKGLQESNRLLGIISHVPQLKNEIHAKLQITPSHQGSELAFSFGQHEISKPKVKL